MRPQIELRARERAEPLPVSVVLARGEAARALAARLIARFDGERDARSRVSIVRSLHGGEPVLVALGSAEDLPWVDGAVWLGRDPEAPTLLLPAVLTLEPHPALVARALAHRCRPPFALVSHDEAWLALSLVDAGELCPDGLRSLVAWGRDARDSPASHGSPTPEAP